MHRPILIALALALACSPDAPPAAGRRPANRRLQPAGVQRDRPRRRPVTIIEFTDLQCPYCARYASQTFPRLKREYVTPASCATRRATCRCRSTVSRCLRPWHHAAPGAGSFLEYREALFASQSLLGTEPYGRIAGQLGLDVEQFEHAVPRASRNPTCARTWPWPRSTASAPRRRSSSAGGGRRVPGRSGVGAQPYEIFKAKLDALLAEPR